jgi:excisionase family DNA binding protein
MATTNVDVKAHESPATPENLQASGVLMAGEVLTADEVAAWLRVDRKTVYDAAGRGKIPHRRLGKRLLFSRAALVDWLACKCPVSTEG